MIALLFLTIFLELFFIDYLIDFITKRFISAFTTTKFPTIGTWPLVTSFNNIAKSWEFFIRKVEFITTLSKLNSWLPISFILKGLFLNVLFFLEMINKFSTWIDNSYLSTILIWVIFLVIAWIWWDCKLRWRWNVKIFTFFVRFIIYSMLLFGLFN